MNERIKFYTDEHVARAVARGLRERGADVLTVPEAGMLGASDEEQLAHARREGRVIFTQDDDFLRLHAAGFAHAGIVYAPQQTSIGQIIYGLMLIYQVLTPKIWWGRWNFCDGLSLQKAFDTRFTRAYDAARHSIKLHQTKNAVILFRSSSHAQE